MKRLLGCLVFVAALALTWGVVLSGTSSDPVGLMTADVVEAETKRADGTTSLMVDGVTVAKTSRPGGTRAFVHLPYYDSLGQVSFDVHIEETYYNANQAALDAFWDLFEVRFDSLKAFTGWSSRQLFGVPLELYVYGTQDSCNFGSASPTHGNVVLSDPLYQAGCERPYYDGGTPVYGNPGPLGDHWPQMHEALRQTVKAIMPYPIYTRSWLCNGFAYYLAFRTLVVNGDINQETADTYGLNGYDILQVSYSSPDTTFASYPASEFNWNCYVGNDYHDCTVYERQWERSEAYGITSHAFSILQAQHGLDWDVFYSLLNNNQDALDRTFALGPPYIYYTDAFVIYVLGLAMGHVDYDIETEPIFRYDGPGGPGLGNRHLVDSVYTEFDWFGDLVPSVSIPNDTLPIGDTVQIDFTVQNIGDVNMNDNVVRVYVDSALVHTDTLDVNKYSSQARSLSWVPPDPGEFEVLVIADEENLKIELSDTNNTDVGSILVYGDSDSDGVTDLEDNCPSVANPDQTDTDGDGVGDSCDVCSGFNDGDDVDVDGIPDSCDNCPAVANSSQDDGDGDSVGDLCDNCVMTANADQSDGDSDGWGDECDNCPGVSNPDQSEDVDADGVGDPCDNCVDVVNTLQEDTDFDTVGDSCDNCIITPNPDQTDSDADSVGNECDNCPDEYNPDQLDSDDNGIGDACEGCCQGIRGNVDGDENDLINIVDMTTLVAYLFSGGAEPPCFEEGDVTGDGLINIVDATSLVAYLFNGGPAPADCP